jgi:hypothetical protein
LREGPVTGNIFISYRHEDSAAYAGRLCDHLTAVFGESRVFMDIEDISPGQNFAQTIDKTIADCGAILVVIGPRWMEILRSRSSRHEQDFVRREIEEALETQSNQAEYESAFKTYQDALKVDPRNQTVMDGQVNAAMLWLQDFHAIIGEGQKRKILPDRRYLKSCLFLMQD